MNKFHQMSVSMRTFPILITKRLLPLSKMAEDLGAIGSKHVKVISSQTMILQILCRKIDARALSPYSLIDRPTHPSTKTIVRKASSQPICYMMTSSLSVMRLFLQVFAKGNLWQPPWATELANPWRIGEPVLRIMGAIADFIIFSEEKTDQLQQHIAVIFSYTYFFGSFVLTIAMIFLRNILASIAILTSFQR